MRANRTEEEQKEEVQRLQELRRNRTEESAQERVRQREIWRSMTEEQRNRVTERRRLRTINMLGEFQTVFILATSQSGLVFFLRFFPLADEQRERHRNIAQERRRNLREEQHEARRFLGEPFQKCLKSNENLGSGRRSRRVCHNTGSLS